MATKAAGSKFGVRAPPVSAFSLGASLGRLSLESLPVPLPIPDRDISAAKVWPDSRLANSPGRPSASSVATGETARLMLALVVEMMLRPMLTPWRIEIAWGGQQYACPGLALEICAVIEAVFPGGVLVLQFLLLLVFPVAFTSVVSLGEGVYRLELLVLGLPLILARLFAEFRVLNGNSLLFDGIVDTREEILIVAQDEPGDTLQGGVAQALCIFFPVLFEHLKAAALALLGSNQLAKFAGRFVGTGLHQIEKRLECKGLWHLKCSFSRLALGWEEQCRDGRKG